MKLILILAVSLITALPLAAAPTLAERLEPLIRSHQGKIAVALKHLTTGEEFRHRADVPMPTASLIKLAVMIEAYRQADSGSLDLKSPVTLTAADKVPGSGILTQYFSPGARISLRDAIHLMISFSDNTATNLVLDRVGLQAVNRTLAALGCPNTRIHAKVFRRDTSIDPERSRRFGLGSTTCDETIRLLAKLHAKTLATPGACRKMLQHLESCRDRGQLVRWLPNRTRVAHKTGATTSVRCDAGIVFAPSGPFVICVLTSENKDRSWGDNNAAERLLGKIARAVFYHFEPAAATATAGAGLPKPTLGVGDSGLLVENLQRTLNARLKPSPELSVDGEYGPVTEAAVRRFQKARKLDPSGVVDAKTWTSLGTLVTQDPPLPAPDVVNRETLPVEPREALTGPPVVSCKAWAIADAKTGILLWGNNAARRLDIASTTKIMTGYLVLRRTREHPAELDETVTFSARADGTGGSTAGIRAGESLPVRELLYGLLLPSGNDASVALGEHFGARLHADSESTADPLQLFERAMNSAAEALGMHDTTFKNPHGLTAAGHLSTAADLVKLTHAALALRGFQTYINTRQRGCEVVGAGGYRRRVLWRNTNRLLPREGYSGVKTGTTRAAGACLVSLGERAGDALIVVVLGSASSAARYVDTRNLFRWGWRMRGHR